MASLTHLPSGRWRVQVRRRGLYRAETFERRRDAQAWAAQVEAQAHAASATGRLQPPADATLADLIDRYAELAAREPGKTKRQTLAMLRRELGGARLADLSAVLLRDFVDRRVAGGAGGATVAADLSFLSAVLKWARHARRLDVDDRLALDARAGLRHRGLDTRSGERDREPTDAELARLYAHWRGSGRQRIDMVSLCRFALASAMRLGEIAGLQVEDVDREARTALVRDRKDPRRKAGNDQTVPLLPDAWAIVAPLVEGRIAGQVFAGVRAASASTAFTRACQALGIEDLRFHDLRHRAAADLFRRGLQIPEVALLTGHKTWAMLRRYTSIKPADVHAAFEQAAALRRQAEEGGAA